MLLSGFGDCVRLKWNFFRQVMHRHVCSNLSFVSASTALISMSASTRDFFKVLSRDSGSSIPPDESFKFGATSWLGELDDGVSNNSARLFRYCVIGQVPGLHVCQVVCLSTIKRVFPTKIDVVSMFACQTTSHLCFHVFFIFPGAF